MDEPSVLDFVLEKLAFWREGKVVIPSAIDGKKPPDSDLPGDQKPKLAWKKLFIFLPPLFAITAQLFSEPPNRSSSLVIFFYTAAAGGLLLLIFYWDWQIEPLIPEEGEAGIITVRYILFGIGIVFGVFAFLFFIGNIFNPVNTFLWITSLVLIWWSLWTPENWWNKLTAYWKGFWENGIRITLWSLLVAGVFLLAGFYRLYLLNQVPPEMFSDHAEKLIDVTDVLSGQFFIFFPRNTGREALQMYLTAGAAKVFGTGVSFLSLKLGTCLAGLVALPFIYLLGKEIKGREVGLLAMFFAGIAYWPNVISRVALRFALFPAFAAPTLYFLVRGLKRKRWNDFLYAGLVLGIGLHGYSPFRIVPIAVVIILLIYFLHTSSKENRRQAIIALVLIGLISMVVFLPLMRFATDNYDVFSYRMLTRMTDAEHLLPGSTLSIFFNNLWKSLIMFQWDNGQIWVHSIPGRPALGLISAAMFSIGIVLVAVRYIRNRHWMDLVLLLMIPILLLPSVLSIAFPDENPSLNRSGGALIPVFIVIGIAVENLFTNIRSKFPGRWGKWASWVTVLLLVAGSAKINAELVFVDYYEQFKSNAWNTSEIGHVVKQFIETIGDEDHAWVVPYPHWVDTRLVGIQAVQQVKDYALWRDDIGLTTDIAPPKLFIYKPEDLDTYDILQDLYPDGINEIYNSAVNGRNFMIYYVLR
ncbi:MAG: glycosyltransferase family 39 protein [Anaerolineales bacterium]|nr:glycosyltransferase family 39 protein [Anaerolineales bacterium]